MRLLLTQLLDASVGFSINGFGTTFYGRRVKARDGSYITTKWFILACLPVIPLGSVRLKDQRRGFSRQDYDVVDDVPIDVVQVFNTYVYVYLLMPAALYWVLVKPPLAPAMFAPGVAVLYGFWPLLVLALLPHILRAFSKEQGRPARRRQS